MASLHCILRAALMAVLALILFSALGQQAHADDIAVLKASVVKVTAQLEGKSSTGTGFIIRSDRNAVYILTAAHVIEGDPKPEVTFFRDPARSFTAKVMGMEGGDPHGLAVLVVLGAEAEGLRALDLEPTGRVSVGQPVTIIGFPPHGAWAVTSGSISGLKGRTVIVEAPVAEGNSGGPVIYDGRVLGVLTESRGALGFAVLSVVADFTLRGWGVEAKGESLQMVTLTGTLSNAEWMVSVNIADQAAEILVKIGTDDQYRSTGFENTPRPGTNTPLPRASFTLPEDLDAKVAISIKYRDLTGRDRGPYELVFDPQAERVRSAKNLLEGIVSSWLDWRRFDGNRLLVYFTNLLNYSDSLVEIRYSVDKDSLSERFPLRAGARRFHPGDEVYIEVPMATEFLVVKLTYLDGTSSDRRKFQRPKRLED